jgi:aspartate/methionine/tyrosine aminotransferase
MEESMRRSIVHHGVDQLTYEIRGIVALAKQLQQAGVEISWENIGDPIQKGEILPAWIKEIISDLLKNDRTYGYIDTQGIPETRDFLAEMVNRRGGCRITRDDIIMFNGLGDAVARIFGYMRREARVIGPSPAYSTHSSAEAAHSGYEHLTYDLDPRDNWMPDLWDIENKIKYNDSISGILIINPDNPTGAVYPRPVLEGIVDIARRHSVFIICDEIYANIVYNGARTASLSEVIGDRPGMALRGISKEFPWPGARCGWLEVYNKDRYPEFKTYIQSMVKAKMLEVCSTSLPQFAIPRVMGDPRYAEHLERRNRMFEARVNRAYDILSGINGTLVVRPRGAFYMTVLFEDGVLNGSQKLAIANERARAVIEQHVVGVEPDKRFVYYLLGATGICVVPLTGFCCSRQGFRLTMLETDEAKADWIWKTLADSISDYLASA